LALGLWRGAAWVRCLFGNARRDAARRGIRYGRAGRGNVRDFQGLGADSKEKEDSRTRNAFALRQRQN
jgi:hypothetical protein